MSLSGPKAGQDFDSESESRLPNPVIIELQPNGVLQAAVYTHELVTPERIPCWTYISDGLAKLGQKEVVFTIRRRTGEALNHCPPEPLEWFDLLYSLSKKGQFANNEFSYTEFSNPNFLGRSDITMIVYTRPQPMDGLPPNALPDDYLQAVALTEPEANVSKKYGVLRALSHLGLSVRYFPYPAWIDRERNTVITLDELSQSIVGKCAAVSISGIQAVKEDDGVYVYVRPWAIKLLQEVLALIQPQLALAVFSELHNEADSCLVWKAGQEKPAAIGTSTNHTSLCFVAICPQQQTTYFQMFEDGYVDNDWQNIRDSVASGQSLEVSAGAESKFYLEMMPESYENPVDGLSYISPGGWKKYRQSSSRPTPAEQTNHPHVKFGEIILLTNPSPQKCDVDAFTAYVKDVEATIVSGLPRRNPVTKGSGKAVIVQLDVSNNALAKVQVYAEPNLAGLDIGKVQTSIRGVPVPSKVQLIRFQLTFDVWGGMSKGG